MIRPQPARWFEAIVARDDAFLTLEALAAAGCVEIEWHAAAAAEAPQDTAAALKAYAQLARRYGRYWPPPAPRFAHGQHAPSVTLAAAVAALNRWAVEAEAPVAELQRTQAYDRELLLAQTGLRELADSDIDFSQLARANQGIAAALFALPLEAAVDVPPDVLSRWATVTDEQLLLAVGPAASIEQLARAVADTNGRQARFPDWLQPTASANLELVAQRREELRIRIDELRARIDALTQRHAVGAALGDVQRASWCLEHGGAIALGEPDRGDVFARITGWTVDAQRLIDAVEASGARAIVSFPPAPRNARVPLTLANPWWVRPFEMFPRLVGMPAATGTDPSMLLAFTAPLMFGYMFGDVGQGAVLIVIGWLLRNRLPVLQLLIPGGIAAIGFGFVFGSVFSFEHVIEPLWLLPMEHPLPVLIVPIVAGALLLVLGLLLELLEAWWQGQALQWLREDAPLLLVYVGVLTGLIDPAGGLLAAAGVLWAAGAGAWHTRSGRRGIGARAGAAGAALGELLERTIQILINTLSFARIGAFALAHAGLSMAVVTLALAAGHPAGTAVVLVLGNALIIAIEGLIVSIQTTRLVLFEFFTRFFRPEGREFRPLVPPQFLSRP